MSVIETTRRPLELSGMGTVPSSSAHRSMIEFAMEPQCHSNWCWAAVAASVAAYYDQGTYRRQCKIANEELQRTDCCDWPCGADVAFDVTNVFASPLNRVGCFRRLARFKRATPAQVLEELAAGRPVCVRTVWPEGGAHFLTIVGCWCDADGTPMLALDDPFWGRSEYGHEQFSKHYQLLGGKWNDTYYTKQPSRLRVSAEGS
jgi:Papain-like cysteine protease AvrRpt2